MPAPSNDNWASASALSDGGAGSEQCVAGTNVDATAQTGEPANNGSTVWYSFTPATSRIILFSTAYQPGCSESYPNPYLQSKLQIFTGSSVSALMECTYEPLSFTTRCNNYDLGSCVAVDMAAGTTYYIRVDCASGSVPQGAFCLYQGDWNLIRLGACSGCPPQFQQGLTCIATAQPTPGAEDSCSSYVNTVDFGTLPAGVYIVSYCGGANKYDGWDGTGWAVSWSSYDGGFTAVYYTVNIYDGDVGEILNVEIGASAYSGWPTNISESGMPPTYPSTLYASQSEAEAAFLGVCFSSMFYHAGGDMSLSYNNVPSAGDCYPPVVTAGDPAPSFGLYSVRTELAFAGACVKWTTVGSAAEGYFYIKNNNSFEWQDLSFSLASSGGVSGSSTTTGTIGAGATETFIITFNASTTNITAAVLNITCGGGLIASFTINLAPILTVSLNSTGTSDGESCTESGVSWPTKDYTFTLANAGYWDFTPQVEWGGKSNAVPVNGSCTNLSTSATATTEVGCIAGTPQTWTLRVALNPSGSPHQINMGWQDETGHTYLGVTTYTFN